MLEAWDFAAIVAVSMFCGAVAAALLVWLKYWQLEAMMRSTLGTVRGQSGVDRRAEQQEEMERALVDAALIAKSEGTPQEKAKAFAGLAVKYPRVAMKLAKKMGISGLGDLMGSGDAA
jgi:hypothetical protein